MQRHVAQIQHMPKDTTKKKPLCFVILNFIREQQ